MKTELAIRDFASTDEEYEAIAQISNVWFSEYQNSPAGFRHWDESLDRTKYIHKRYVAVDDSGRIIGRGEYGHSVVYFDSHRFWMWVEVDPDAQHRGIGSRLYDKVMQDLIQLGAKEVVFREPPTGAELSERIPEAVRFAVKRGFKEVMSSWESRLDLQAFDPAPFRKYLERMEEQGIAITTLAQEKETNHRWIEDSYELYMRLMSDVPAPYPYTPPPIEQFRRRELESPESIPEAFFIAKDGDRYVGESWLGRNATGPYPLSQGLTGTLPEYRGRGIAMALKLTAIEWAKREGYTMLKTWNNVLNEGMLAINTRLGFVRQPAWIVFRKDLRE
jgi:GNAT superfamily N-acetyltransferase